jgi:hypothetical protein
VGGARRVELDCNPDHDQYREHQDKQQGCDDDVKQSFDDSLD